MDRLNIYFIITFAIIGVLVSLMFSLFSGNSILSILVNMMFSTFLSAFMGLIVYQILKAKVPEFLEVFDLQLKAGSISQSSNEFNYQNSIESKEELEPSEEVFSYKSDDSDDSQISFTESEPKTETKHFGDHILVNKVSIKNEPKLMAQAIRTMLSKDD